MLGAGRPAHRCHRSDGPACLSKIAWSGGTHDLCRTDNCIRGCCVPCTRDALGAHAGQIGLSEGGRTSDRAAVLHPVSPRSMPRNRHHAACGRGRSLAWQTSPRSLTSIRIGNLGQGVNGADNCHCYEFPPSLNLMGPQSTGLTSQTGRTSWRSLLRIWQGPYYRVNVKAGIEAVPESSLTVHVARARMCPGRPHVGGAVGLHSSAPPKSISVTGQFSGAFRRGSCKCQVSPRASISAAGARTRLAYCSYSRASAGR